MNFLNNPNLPEKNVKISVCDIRISENIKNELANLGVKCLFVPIAKKLQIPVAAHPDIHMCYIGNGSFYTSTEFCEILTNCVSNIDCELFNNAPIKTELIADYPGDVPLNCVTVGDYLICNPKTVYKEIIETTSKKIIAVKQGYTKCSTCIVSDNAIITDDESIRNAVKDKLDVLYVNHGPVNLTGYNYGFIGGCCGKLSKDTIGFTGDLNSCEFAEDIRAFCKNYKVDCISLSKERLYDYGSLIPIAEE